MVAGEFIRYLGCKIAEVLQAKGGYLRQNVTNPGVDDYHAHPTGTKHTQQQAVPDPPTWGTHGC